MCFVLFLVFVSPFVLFLLCDDCGTFLVVFGPCWYFLVVFGPCWFLLVIFGLFWYFVGCYCTFWYLLMIILGKNTVWQHCFLKMCECFNAHTELIASICTRQCVLTCLDVLVFSERSESIDLK